MGLFGRKMSVLGQSTLKHGENGEMKKELIM